MELPTALRRALERALQGRNDAALARDAEALSRRYREGHSRERGPQARSEAEALAYAAHRLPATYAAARAALGAAAAALPGLAVASALDAGAGPGVATWAAAETWPALARATLLEREPAMLELGRRLTAEGPPALAGATWRRSDLAGAWAAEPADLVTAGYLLGELGPDERRALVARLWELSRGLLVLIEPGSPRGFAIIDEARSQLIAAGAHIAAPCPHAAACPLALAGDWCHFAARIARPPAQRRAKGAALGFEDEKFSYVAASRAAPAPVASRVVARPAYHPGRVDLTLCRGAGDLARITVARSAGPAYRAARDTAWGDGWAGPGATDYTLPG